MQLLTAKFNQIASAINTTNAQIAALFRETQRTARAPAATTLCQAGLSIRPLPS
jgi:outer membrane murein-binding lipoprotein Lpp